MRATKKTSKKNNIAGKIFFISRNELVFFSKCFLSPEIDCFFPKIGNNLMRALGRKKHMVFFGNARSKSNARAHLKQKKNIVALEWWEVLQSMMTFSPIATHVEKAFYLCVHLSYNDAHTNGSELYTIYQEL